MALFLTSLTFDGLDAWLAGLEVAPEPGTRVALIGNASHGLPDAEAIVAPARAALSEFDVQVLDAADPSADLRAARAVVLTGGDPFRLLADLKHAGADQVLQQLHARGTPIAGQSAGAMVCARHIEPVRHTSPFTAPADQDLSALGIANGLVLPHHDRPGRAAWHRQAALTQQSAQRLMALWDDEVLLQSDSGWQIVSGGRRTRRARHDDAAAIEEIFSLATRTGWRDFIDAEALARVAPDLERWRARIASRDGLFLVCEDAAGLLGFVYAQPYEPGLPDRAEPVAELDLLYSHPRAWGQGVGRRLLARATWDLLCQGYRQAVLWTEARNARALAVYHAAGWRNDGAVDERAYLGTAIRNLRHRLDLTRSAGEPF